MKNIFLISFNTVKEIQRHKIFYALLVLFVFIIFMGFILGSLSLNEQTRLSINFTFTACHISLMLISIYFSSLLISQEIQTKTILTLFVRPVSRMEFILGKFLGLSCILIGATLCLMVFLLGTYFMYQHAINSILFAALWGMFLESLILAAVCFLFSSFTSSFVIFIYTIFIFIIGHSISGVNFLISKNKSNDFLSFLISLVSKAFPNLEKINWRAHALYQDSLQTGELLFSTLYSFSWIVLLLIVTGILFQRRAIV